MSHNPPPPYYGYPAGAPPPPPGGFAFVPAPIMMPVYPPQPPAPEPSQHPTYVTNHIYHPPAGEPQHPPQPRYVEEEIDWVSTTPTQTSHLEARALVAGHEGWDGSPLWVIRAHHNGEFVPGKLAVKHQAAFIPHGGREVPVHNFEVLLAKPHAVRWLPSSNGQVPVGAIPAGNTHKGEPLYIARVKHMNSLTPGKVHPSHGCCYISFGGSEITHKSYEVLCKVVG